MKNLSLAMAQHLLSLLVILLSMSSLNVVESAPLTTGNIIYRTNDSAGNELLAEYTLAGELVQTFDIPWPEGNRPAYDTATDVAVSSTGQIYVFNGLGLTATYLSILDPSTGLWSHRTTEGWNHANVGGIGGVAVNDNYAFATDALGSGALAPNGILRFDLANNDVTRFAEGSSFADNYGMLSFGPDGLLYASRDSFRTIDVFDPNTLDIVRILDLPSLVDNPSFNTEGFAVTQSDDLLLVFDGLYRVDQIGNLAAFRNGCADGAWTCHALFDVEVSPSGVVVVGSRLGGIVVTDEDFSSVFEFSTLTGYGGNITLVPALIPIPGGLWLLGSALGLLGWMKRKSG